MITERFAISYSDGSFGVLDASTDLKQARLEREICDYKEDDPAHLSNIVRVRIEVLETVEAHRKESAA